uniref:Uncharacterized protein n=1 Tax=Chlorobium chlorochromatii (strain CaD3) TaxID=340177 RepID=Q3ATM8_CHLCH
MSNPNPSPLSHAMPEAIRQLPAEAQQEVLAWVEKLLATQNEGVDELYNAISSIVKFIPNFMVIPLMVEQIHPRIAAGVCVKMGVEKATGYANDLPVEYLSSVTHHLPNPMVGEILTAMKRYAAEKLITYEIEHHRTDLQALMPSVSESHQALITKHLST